ncbi:armadillo repeat-containing protein 4 [Salarias fasciatus]|nr:armadillo repeat-containing protein 4 [Salarias fasciatus]
MVWFHLLRRAEPLDDCAKQGKRLRKCPSDTPVLRGDEDVMAQSAQSARRDSTAMTESLLKAVQRLVEHLGSWRPPDAERVLEQPLRWTTSLAASDFQAGYDVSGSAVQSQDRDGDGRPLLQLSPPTVSVLSLSQLAALLQLAGDRSLEELRTCLEENRDLMVRTLGSSLASVTQPEDVQRLLEGVREDRAPDPEAKVKLLLLLHSQDRRIGGELMEEVCRAAGLDPSAVKKEVQRLQRLCGDGEDSPLRSLRYTSDVEFPNGCRSPPWRQLLGEMCYLVIEPCDTDVLHVTCSSDGVFLNGGIRQEQQESGYEPAGATFTDIVTLLKSKSPRFAESMKNQQHAAAVEERPQASQHVESVSGEEPGQPQRSEQQQVKNVRQIARRQHEPNKAGGEKKYDPCPRWRNLGLLSAAGNTGGKKAGRSLKEEEKKGKAGARGKMKADVSVSSLPGRLSSQKIKSSAAATSVELFSSSESESDEEADPSERRPESSTDLPPEYWQIQKLVKFLKGGDQTVTVLSLCHMMDLSLMQETCQLAIRDLGGLEVLVNLLNTNVIKCKIGSLKILRKISHNEQIRRSIVDMGGLQSIVEFLDSPDKDLKALAAETIANVARFSRARRTVRQNGGIEKLVKLLDCVPHSDQEQDVEAARCGALALWSCSKSTKNKEAIRRAGGIPLLGRLLQSPLENMLIPVVGTLQECASEESYRLAIQTEGMIQDLVRNLSRDNQELQMHCASAIFKCAEDKKTRDVVRQHNGLQPLVALLKENNNKELLAAAAGAVWKCSISTENVVKFQEFMSVETLVGLLSDQPEAVLVNVAGALGEFLRLPENRAHIRRCGGIRRLVDLLSRTNQMLLVNVTKAIGACATDKENMAIIDQLDGVRLVWSLLKNPSADVESSAAWALCPCIQNAKDSGEMVRSFVGGLEVIVNLLKSTNKEVLASICSVITKIAKDEENLAVLTDHGVVPLLARLTATTDDGLRGPLAEAIGHCCRWSSNRADFGEAGAVAPLVHFLRSKDSAVRRSTAMALHQLSKDPLNIITMHEKGVVKPLIVIMASEDEELQEAAAGCVRNIRMLALANMKSRSL